MIRFQNRFLEKMMRSLCMSCFLIAAVNAVQIKDFNQALHYLQSFGYLQDPEANSKIAELRIVNPKQAEHDMKMRRAVYEFQRYAGLREQSGYLNEETVKMMASPRCGVADRGPQRTWHYHRFRRYRMRIRNKRYAIQGDLKWPDHHLKYYIKNYPSRTYSSRRQFDEAIAKALRVWSNVSPLKFTRASSHHDADIVIEFARGEHGDNKRFDGVGAVLAHAFWPGEDALSGDAHFDDAELWSSGPENDARRGMNIIPVAAHEFGHSLGLGHSSFKGALMYPWYHQRDDGKVRLHQDDISGVHKLYGAGGRIPTPTVKTTTVSSNVKTDKYGNVLPDTCHTSFDAVAYIRHELHFFKDKWHWRARPDSPAVPKIPIFIHHFWRGLPEGKVDAVFEHPTTTQIVFFIKDRYYIFEGNRLQDRYKQGLPLSYLGIASSVEHIDAAFVWEYPMGTEKRIYLVRGKQYWRLDSKKQGQGETLRVAHDYPRSMSKWKNIKLPVDSAFSMNKKLYFIHNGTVVKFNNRRMKAGKERSMTNFWKWCAHSRPVRDVHYPVYDDEGFSMGYNKNPQQTLIKWVLIFPMIIYNLLL